MNATPLCPNLILNPLFYDILDNSILPTSWEPVVERSICVLRVQSKVGKVMNIFRINFNSDCEPYSPLFPLLFAFHFLSISRAAILILLPNCNDIHFVILYFLHFLFFFFSLRHNNQLRPLDGRCSYIRMQFLPEFLCGEGAFPMEQTRTQAAGVHGAWLWQGTNGEWEFCWLTSTCTVYAMSHIVNSKMAVNSQSWFNFYNGGFILFNLTSRTVHILLVFPIPPHSDGVSKNGVLLSL